MVGFAVDGHLVFFHHFEQCRLCFCRGAVDLIDEDDIGKDGAGIEKEFRLLHIENRRTDDVTGHQVGGELDAREADVEGAGQQLGSEGFGDAGNAFHQDVPPGEDGGQQ